MNSNEVCIAGNRYKIVGANDPQSSNMNMGTEQSTSTETDGEKLDKVVDILSGGDSGYAYVEMAIPQNNNQFEVSLGINATQMHVRCDKDISLKMNSKSGDDISLLADDFPFTMSELRPNESIRRLYVTTGTSGDTTVKVIAIGYR